VVGRSILGRNVDQQNLGIGCLHAARDRIGCGYRETGAAMNRSGHAGAIDQHLQHGALFIVGGYDYD